MAARLLIFSVDSLRLAVLLSLVACSSATNAPSEQEGGAGGSAAGESPGGKGGQNGGEGGRTNGGGGSAGAAPVAGANVGGSITDGGSGGGGGEDGPQEYGFTLRKPGDKHLDWLCTFQGASEPGHVYVRLLQTGTKQTGLTETPVYEAELAQVSVNGVVSQLGNAAYDYGGGHHNDSLSFDHGGKTQRYYHSSFGFGWRACQPMDCRNIHEPGATEPSTEGCGPERSLPEVCVSINPDGTHDPLTDAFMKCPGDDS